jgi:hypothetical protein
MTEDKPRDADELQQAIHHYRAAGQGKLSVRTLDQYRAVGIWLEELRSFREGQGGVLPSCHSLKCWPEHFRAVARGAKRAELRRDDRDFKADDLLRLEEWEYARSPEAYTGRFLVVRVTHILYASDFPEALKPGYVMLSIGAPETYGGAFDKEELPS